MINPELLGHLNPNKRERVENIIAVARLTEKLIRSQANVRYGEAQGEVNPSRKLLLNARADELGRLVGILRSHLTLHVAKEIDEAQA